MVALPCTYVNATCPVELTLYGYYPDLGGNSFFTAAFVLLFVAQLAIGIWKKTWTYTLAVSLGCLGEFIGYVGRILENGNPWNIAGIGMNILCLVVSPSFMAAGIYLTLKHIVTYCGPDYSRIKPKWYPWIFILCDVCSILIQAIGGALGATAQSGSTNLLDVGDALIITGIVLQVVTMSIFGLLALEYFWRRRKAVGRGSLRPANASSDAASSPELEKPDPASAAAHASYDHRKFQWFIWGISFAYTTILIRCIYRIVEMAGGWGGTIMRNEPSFLVLDGAMVLLAAIALTAAHPGFLFEPMQKAKGW